MQWVIFWFCFVQFFFFNFYRFTLLLPACGCLAIMLHFTHLNGFVLFCPGAWFWSEYSGMNRCWNQLKWICIREQLQININFVSLKVEGRRGEPQCQQIPSYAVRGVLYFSRAMERCFSGAMTPAAACVKRRENDAFPCVVCHVCPLFIFLPLNWKGSGKSTFSWRIKRYRKMFSPGANLKSLLTDKPH